MNKKVKHVLLAIIAVIVVGIIAGWAYLQHPKFGQLPSEEAMTVLERSPNHRDGQFHNLMETPALSDGESVFSVLWDNARADRDGLRPNVPLPSAKSDLRTYDLQEDLVVWLGHSSYYVQLNGRRLLIDPVFSRNAAPIPFANQAFEGTTLYSADEMPPIDYVLITHDHWDHLDYPTLKALEPKVDYVITGLGMETYFEQWGYAPDRIHAQDWNDVLTFDDGLRIHVLPARHYSGRLLTRNQTLWVSFALETSERRLYFSGDSGYGEHFTEIGQRLGDFDLVALDHGQYDPRWAHIHMTPEEASHAADDLNTRLLMPGHAGRFALAQHRWDEPFERLVRASETHRYQLVIPLIGQVVALDAPPALQPWW
ncbi:MULTISPECIES: MBL fold metallo-hydrolase [unclassified Halomonas]|uniref:MBL fold metallo-hydrolase n=1 Tax=unclassified Halomonas TaxID=2609666 RepID=UPI002076939D|nr:MULTISPECIES: MBL fold metallo-hydrolase [unclassified Halomonas]